MVNPSPPQPAPSAFPAGPFVRTRSSVAEFVGSVEALAERIADEARISPGGFHLTRVPVVLLEAVARRRPRDLTWVAWGGGIGLEILLEAGCVRHISFCFSNLDVFGIAPAFRRALESGSVTYEEWTALEFQQALLAAASNLPAMPLQAPAGSWRAPSTDDPTATVASPPVGIDTVLLHASRADTFGNLEIDGAPGLDRALAFAGRRVLATVEEVVAAAEFGRAGVVVPRQFVEAIAVAPGGAWPTSSLPHYAVDIAEVARRTAAGRISAEREGDPPPDPPPQTRRVARLDWHEQPPPTDRAERHEAADQMIAWLARRLDDRSVCSVGSVSPLATIAYLVAKASHAPRLTLLTTNGCYLDVGQRLMSLSFAEAADHASAATICGSDESYRWLYQQGRVTHEIVSAAQIDGGGATNNGWIAREDGSWIRLPGQGGMADVANMHANFLLYATRQSARQLVTSVDRVTAQRAIRTPEARAAAGYAPGEVVLVTDLAVFRLAPDGRFALDSIHDWVARDELVARTGFEVRGLDEATRTVPPTDEERALIDRIDPFGIRRLEFVPSRDRADLIAEILAAEASYLASAKEPSWID